jgi:hypothetical protein
MTQKWQTLDRDKILAGCMIVANAKGQPLRSPRGIPDVEELSYVLDPYYSFAFLTLTVGAFDYPRNEKPTEEEVNIVMLDFLRAIGEADASDVIKIRTEMLKSEWTEELQKPAKL